MALHEIAVPEISRSGTETAVTQPDRPEDRPLVRRPAPLVGACLAVILTVITLGGCGSEGADSESSAIQPHRPPPDSDTLAVPSGDIFDPPWLERRAERQRKALEGQGPYHDFRFTDRRQERGVDFLHRGTDETGRDYHAIHYDHGNSVAVADVDGDGRLDLFFANQAGANRLYRNIGDGNFRDITERAGVGLPDRVSVAASFADTDNDGDPDLFVSTVREGNVFYENDGSGNFRNVTAESGLGAEGHYSAGVFFDYDRDGRLDLFVTNVGKYTKTEKAEQIGFSRRVDAPLDSFHVGVDRAFFGHVLPRRNRSSILYRNVGDNQFRDVTEEMGLSDDVPWTGDASPIDYNRDGWPDLYALNMQGHDVLYENVRGERFRRVTRQVFPRTPWGTMGIKAFDYDNDGDRDLILTDMHSDMSHTVEPTRENEKTKSDMRWPKRILRSQGRSIFGNAFFRNDSSGSYTEISQEIGAENYWPWGVSVGDLNADGFTDVFIASGMSFPFRYGINTLLLNRRGQEFVDSEFVLGVEPRRSGRLAKPWFVLDCAVEDRWHRRCRKQGRETVQTVWSSRSSRSSVIFDLGQDGDLDVVTNEFNDVPLVLVSNLSDEKPDLRYLKVDLVGAASNRDGLGARVTVHAGDRTLTRVMDGQSGYLTQSSKPLYFGLGEAERVDSVAVEWPSGQRQVVPSVEINQLLTVEEPPAGAEPEAPVGSRGGGARR